MFTTMKKAIKKSAHSAFRLFSTVETSFFSHSLISSGYAIKSEHFFNHCGAKDYLPDRLILHRHLATEYVNPAEEIIYLEFGVMRGDTFFIWSECNTNPASRLVGFDTFTGLPEDWGSVKKGSFSAGGKIPDIKDTRAEFCVGLIQDTLPEFTKRLDKTKRKVIHIDVDLYNASLITLIHLQPFMQRGDIIIFDDFFTLTKADHEFKSFLDFLSLYKTPYKPVYRHRSGHFVIELQ
jgi:hypothetical protein